MTQDFFGTASFAIVANETYARGCAHFLEDEMGLPCTFAVSRTPGAKTDNEAVRKLVREKPPLVLFGSYNERMYLAEAGGRGAYIPASFPGAIIRRHTGTPFMGYAGATYLVQEVLQRAVRRAVPHPAARHRPRPVEATPARLHVELAWDDDAKALLDALVEAQPVLVRISAAKRLRDRAERDARGAGEERVSIERLERAARATGEGVRRMTTPGALHAAGRQQDPSAVGGGRRPRRRSAEGGGDSRAVRRGNGRKACSSNGGVNDGR